ncbi:MAG: hypothetical protein LBM39_03150 [Candidatus Methanoplasma sp.]|jgi:hypothetical protein|nr:hypothetical protein [Candidatus Methanoplasma sp.]
MFNIGDWIYGVFGSNETGLILCIFLIFLIDALIFPTLPELFFVVAFMYSPEPAFGIELILAAVIAEIVGVSSLYLLVKRIRIPRRISRVVDKYVGFLVLGDERLLLLNRVAPMIPFCGAVIAIVGWNIKKSLLFVVIGCVVKYGLILLMSDFFFGYFSGDDAQMFTLVFIVAIIIISFVLSVAMGRKRERAT